MRLIDADKIMFELGGLNYIPLHDSIAIADYFMEQLRKMPTIAPPPNEPLTFDELWEMNGEPVWVELLEPTVGKNSGWVLVYNDGSRHTVQRWTAPLWCSEYGETWIAYRFKKEEAHAKHIY